MEDCFYQSNFVILHWEKRIQDFFNTKILMEINGRIDDFYTQN